MKTDTLESAAAAASDSISVAVWTAVSRFSGVARFAVIGAVLGPTFFGNTYQFTNSLPNIVYYGFLGGSLFTSLLVPALVHHIDLSDRRASERVAGGFLGTTLLVLVVIAPVAILLGPPLLRAAAGGTGSVGAEQEQAARWLIGMFLPQVFCYGVIGTATSVMNAHRRFALAAAAPALENLGMIAVLGLFALLFNAGTDPRSVHTGGLLLLGLGTTSAVALHAATQWWGARRVGITLVPRPGWRDAEVRKLVRRALPSVAQTALIALQTLTLLVLANRLPGGVVAFQMALSFHYVAIALGATPVALSLLPRLARIHVGGNARLFRTTLDRGLALGLFATVPAAVGYFVLAVPLARAVSLGRMNSPAGIRMVGVSLAALAVAVVGETVFAIATYASYARSDTRAPLVAVALQVIVCLALASTALLVSGPAVVLILGLAFSVATAAGALHLGRRVWRSLPRGQGLLIPSLARSTLGAAAMAGPAWLVASLAPNLFGPHLGPGIGLIAAAAVGCAVFLAVTAACRAPELRWIAEGFGQLVGGKRATAEVTDG